MSVNNKAKSDYLIKKLDLNRMLEGRFKGYETEKLKQFLEENPFPYYNIRDKGASMGRFLYKLTPDEVLKYAPQYESFAVYESLAEADKKLVLQGDILITKDFTIIASLSDEKGISNRQAMNNPKYKIHADMIYKPYFNIGEEQLWQRLPNVRGLNTLIDYICSHELIGMVVELSLFEIPVGIKKENIIVWEVRNY